MKLQLNDLELASTFMGSDKGITLLEADAILLGLMNEKKGEKLNKKEWKDEIYVGEIVEDDLVNTQEVTKIE